MIDRRKLTGMVVAALLATAAPASTARAEPDENGVCHERVAVFPLQHVEAADMVVAVEDELRRRAGSSKVEPSRIIADQATNSLVVEAKADAEIDAIRAIVASLDKSPTQVFVETLAFLVPAAAARSPRGLDLGRVHVPSFGLVPEPTRLDVVVERSLVAFATPKLLLEDGKSTAVPLHLPIGGADPRADTTTLEITAHLAEDKGEIRLEYVLSQGGVPRHRTMMILKDGETAAFSTAQGFSWRAASAGAEETALYAMVGVHVIRGSWSLARIFEAKLRERQMVLDRLYLFDEPGGLAPLRIRRGSRGLLGAIRGDQRVPEVR